MKNFFEGLILSLGFFTQIKIPYFVKTISPNIYRYMVLTLPLSGIVSALLTIGLFVLLQHFILPLYAAFVASIFYLFLYGFLHLEAVADVIDGYYAKHSGKDAYEVMKDPTIGALGALYTFAFVLLKVGAIIYLFSQNALIAFASITMISRMMAVYLIYKSDFHENSSFIFKMKSALDRQNILYFSIFFLGVLLLSSYLWLVMIALIATFLAQKWLIKHIGFLNGDGLGFVIEINELILLNSVIFLL